MKKLKLKEESLLIGFDSEQEMNAWVEAFDITEDENLPPDFNSCCEYKGEADDCKPKEYWVEKMGAMDSGGFWYKSYKTGDKYLMNHFRWSFNSALDELSNPAFIVVINTKKQ